MRKICTFIILLLTIISLQAAKLENIPVTVTQPNGSKIDCFASGDEFFNRLHDENGFTIIQSQVDGAYYWAVEKSGDLVPSNLLADKTNPKLAGISPNLMISESKYRKAKSDFWGVKGYEKGRAPHEGTLNNVVVYIRFSDQTDFTQPRSFFNAILNDQTTGANSVYNYYKEVSYNKLDLVSTHFPVSSTTTTLSFQDSHPIKYYQPYNSSTNPIGYQDSERTAREHALLKSAVDFIASQVPTSLNIDGDNDGKVDNVSFIIQGGVGAWASLLWPHRWSLYTQDAYINGKKVYDYIFMLSEASNYLNRKVFCHELFHALGAPDLYHYSNQTSNTMAPVKYWDIMESGSGHMGAYMKWKYADQKWVTETPSINTPGRYTIQPLTSATNNCYKIPSPNSTTEFFVLENRRKTGIFEGNLPGSGLLVYRINPDYNGNADGNDEVYIYRPNGTPTSTGSIDQANFPTGTGITNFNSTTNPSPVLTNGAAGGLDLSNIVVNADNSITFDLFGGPSSPIDASTTAIVSPVSGVNLSSAETVTATIKNNGINPISAGFTVSYKVNGGTAITESYTGSAIAVGASVNFTFSQKVNLSVAGNYSVQVTVNLPNDGNANNNSITKVVINTAPTNLPLTESFNATTLPLGWTQQNVGTDITDRWSISNTNKAGGTANEMKFSYQQVNPGTGRLVTPPLKTVGITSLALSFKHMLDDYAAGATLKVQSSSDAINWTDENWSLNTAGSSNVGPAVVSTTITHNLGSATYIALAISGNLYQLDYWYVDDIAVSGTNGIENEANPVNSIIASNYPNPFNNTTRINFSIPVSNSVQIAIYNSVGQLIKSQNLGSLKSGSHSYDFTAGAFNSGIYYYIVKAGDQQSAVKKIVLLK